MTALLYCAKIVYDMMEEIQERAVRTRRRFDHVAYRGICPRCGQNKNLLGQQLYNQKRDVYERPEDYPCSTPDCTGIVKVLYKMNEDRSVHLADISRR